METQQTTARKAAQRDVYAIINDKIIEQLEQGKAPWRVAWTQAGVPRNLISGKPYRGINVMLLASLGYEQNIFITAKQLKKIDGFIRPEEKPHLVVFWNNLESDFEAGALRPTPARKSAFLSYYTVYNIAQCVSIPSDLLETIQATVEPVPAVVNVIAAMQHCPSVRHKDQTAFYDLIEDYVNMPKLKSFEDDESYHRALLHQLVHSTGHHTRLDRAGLAQMFEIGYSSLSLEEMVTEIATYYLLSLTGISGVYEGKYPEWGDWLDHLSKNRYLIFTASSLAQKALDFILNIAGENEDKPIEE